MSARLLFILLLCVIGALCHIIGYWRRKAGEAAFAAARMADKEEERDRYCRLAVMAGQREACRMYCLSRLTSRPVRESYATQAVQVEWHPNGILRILLSVTVRYTAQ